MASEDDIYNLLNEQYQKKIDADNQVVANSFEQKKPGKIAHTSYHGQKSEPYKKPLSDRIIQAIGDPIYNALTQTRAGVALAGLGEGEHQAIASIAHLFNKDAMPDLNLDEYINPELSAYRTGGNIAGNALVDYGLLRGAGKYMRGATGLGGLASRVGASGGIGYATGEQFPEQLGGRAGAAVLSGLFPVTAGSTKGAIGKNIAQAAENAESKYGNAIVQALEGAKPIKPRVDSAMKEILGKDTHIIANTDVKGLLNNYLMKPSAQTAQNAISGLKSAQREILPHGGKLSTLPKHSLDQYKLIEKNIQNLEAALEKSMSPEAFKAYKDSLKDYVKNAVPYKQTSIEALRKGTSSSPSAIPKQIKGMKDYSKTLPMEAGQDVMNQYQFLMKQHPELYINNLAPWAASLGGGGYAVSELGDYLKDLFSSQGNEYEQY